MRTLILTSIVASLLSAGPALANGEHGRRGGGHPGGGCGGCGHGGPSRSVNINVNAAASATAYAGAGAAINARAYDVRSIEGGYGRGAGFGGAVVHGSGYGGWDGPGYAGAVGPVHVSGPGYGPSRPFGYAVEGFGRRYVTLDRSERRADRYSDRRGHDRHDGGYGEQTFDERRMETRSYRETYSVETYDDVYRGKGSDGGEPYLKPDTAYPYVPHPDATTPPSLEHQGDLPPGDDGLGLPYRQEPGERG